jgi:hypothetical protein
MSTYKDSLLGAIRKLCTQLDKKFAKSSDMVSVIGLLSAYRQDMNMYVKKADLYPVGSIIMSITNIDPASLYGGTWVSGAYLSQYGGQIIFSEGATPIDGAPYVYKRIK